MTRVYRILRRPYSKNPFNGEGAYRFGGRWSSPGTRLAYASEHLSLAMLEYFVHIDLEDPPEDLVLATADIPDTLMRRRVNISQLPTRWRDSPAPPDLAAIGDAFVQTGSAAILIVPSALAATESNWLINPLHADFSKVRVRATQAFRYDTRLLSS